MDKFEAKEAVALIIADIKKAFDYFPHELLIEKIKAYIVEGNVLKMFRSW